MRMGRPWWMKKHRRTRMGWAWRLVSCCGRCTRSRSRQGLGGEKKKATARGVCLLACTGESERQLRAPARSCEPVAGRWRVTLQPMDCRPGGTHLFAWWVASGRNCVRTRHPSDVQGSTGRKTAIHEQAMVSSYKIKKLAVEAAEREPLLCNACHRRVDTM